VEQVFLNNRNTFKSPHTSGDGVKIDGLTIANGSAGNAPNWSPLLPPRDIFGILPAAPATEKGSVCTIKNTAESDPNCP